MGKLRPWPTDLIQSTGEAHMWNFNTQLKKLHVTYGQVLLGPPCLKEKAYGFLLLSTAAKLQTSYVLFFYLSGCRLSHVLLQPVQQRLYPWKLWLLQNLSLSCSTPFIAISFCSSCHLCHPLCTYSSGFWFQIELELIFQLNLYPFVGHKTNLFGFWYYFSNTAEHFRKHWVNAKYIYFLIFLIEQSAQKAKNSLLTVSCFSVLLPCLALFLASQSSACRWSRGCKLGLQSIPKESLSIILVMYFFFPPNFLSFWMTFKKVKPFLSESKATSFM